MRGICRKRVFEGVISSFEGSLLESSSIGGPSIWGSPIGGFILAQSGMWDECSGVGRAFFVIPA